MKRLFILFITIAAFITGYGQKNDYVWLSGYEGYPHPIYEHKDTISYYYGTSVMDFNFTPVQIHLDSLQMNFDDTNTSYCDSNGNLLFYTNGCYIANSLNEPIEGSKTLNDGYYKTEWGDTNGYRPNQGILALPISEKSGLYPIIHSLWGTQYFGPYYSSILTTVLDMNANSGHGKVAYINQPVIVDTVAGELSATRHGNGRDWWIPVQKKGTNCFYRILLSDTGFYLLPEMNCGGPVIDYDDFGSSSFSPNGSKYAEFTIYEGLTLFDFDRCSGELTNPLYIPGNIWVDSFWEATGLAFSPSSRFLYIAEQSLILQYDLWSSDIPHSVDTVGVYDGSYSYGAPAFENLFETEQLGPDGKIYISCGNSVPVRHVINNPDAKGDSCNFQQHAIHLPSVSLGVPNFPNYRLGKLSGSACDTITGLDEVARAEKERILKVFPNPATDIVTIDYGFTDWSKTGEVSLEIVNALGQVIYTAPVPHYSGFQKLDVSRYAAGLYTAYIKRGDMVVAVQKFAKE